MTQSQVGHHGDRGAGQPEERVPSVPFGANAIRLSVRQWLVTALVVALCFAGVPVLWKRIEPFDPSPDYRVPYALSDDYWTYQRLVEATVEAGRILIIGDSAIWGEYVRPEDTLSRYLNEQEGAARFANGGLNGTHPLALSGLVRSYAADVTDTRVVLQANLLWMSSEDRDLQVEKELPFNHPRLVPQFFPRIPCYRAPISERIGFVIDRNVAFPTWVNHLRIAYYDSQDLHHWSIKRPYENPAAPIRLEQLQPSDELRHRPIPWTERGIRKQDLPWIDIKSSLQWWGWRETAGLLESRGNSVFVVVGPFNEHLLGDASRKRYRAMKGEVEEWLRDKAIPYVAPEPLPSEEYADASHPLAAGYARLAEFIYKHPPFQDWLGGR